jgi:hypothetical protein
VAVRRDGEGVVPDGSVRMSMKLPAANVRPLADIRTDDAIGR